MTEQELRTSITPCIMAGNTWFVFDQIKAYADARVAQECKVLDEVVTLLHQTIANRNVEITELKASISQAQQMYTDLLVGTTDAISAKDAEIKRLRDGIQKAIDNFFPAIGSHKECIQDLKALLSPELLTNGDCPNCYDGCEWCKSVTAECSLLSPAPVTERLKEVSRETMMKALIDIEDDAHAKMVLGTPLNTKSILMSARHGLGIDSEMIHPQNEDQHE